MEGEEEHKRERDAIQEEPRRLLLTGGESFMQAPREIGAKLIPRLGGRRGGKLGLFGPGGSGKTYMFLNLAVGAAIGQNLLGFAEWTVPHPLRVGLFSLEDPAAELVERLRRLLPFFNLSTVPENLFIYDRDKQEHPFTLAARGGALNGKAFALLEETLGDLKIDLALLEPKTYLVECEENSATENGPWQRKLQEVIIKTGTLAMFGHHAGWSKDSGTMHARGTTIFRDWVDGMIQQTEDTIQGRPGFLLTCNKSNFAARWEPLAVLFDPDTGGMSAADETLSKCPPALLRAVFEEHGGAIVDTHEEIFKLVAERLSCSTITARRAIEDACKNGLLKNEGRGRGFRLL